MSPKQQLIAELAATKGIGVRVAGTSTIFVQLERETIGITEIDGRHQVWVNPKGWGSITAISLKAAVAKINAATA
jgi:hypothetical protein